MTNKDSLKSTEQEHDNFLSYLENETQTNAIKLSESKSWKFIKEALNNTRAFKNLATSANFKNQKTVGLVRPLNLKGLEIPFKVNSNTTYYALIQLSYGSASSFTVIQSVLGQEGLRDLDYISFGLTRDLVSIEGVETNEDEYLLPNVKCVEYQAISTTSIYRDFLKFAIEGFDKEAKITINLLTIYGDHKNIILDASNLKTRVMGEGLSVTILGCGISLELNATNASVAVTGDNNTVVSHGNPLGFMKIADCGFDNTYHLAKASTFFSSCGTAPTVRVHAEHVSLANNASNANFILMKPNHRLVDCGSNVMVHKEYDASLDEGAYGVVWQDNPPKLEEDSPLDSNSEGSSPSVEGEKQE